MAHHHHHHHDNGAGNIKTAFFLNLSFTIIEIVGGIYTGSLAILSDALHDLGDSLSIGLSWYFQGLSKRKRDHKFSYGYRRFSVLGALINAVILLVGSIYIIAEAAPALLNPEEVNEQGMLIIAIFGVVVNGAAVLKLKQGNSLNEKVISLHLLEDVLGWIAVLIGSVLIMYFDWYIIDPLLSLLISVFIIYNVLKNLRSALDIMLQSTPEDVNMEAIESSIRELPFVTDIHDCHVWSMDGEYHVLSAHVVLKDDHGLAELAEMKKTVKALLHEHHVHHSTLEFEQLGEDCEGC